METRWSTQTRKSTQARWRPPRRGRPGSGRARHGRARLGHDQRDLLRHDVAPNRCGPRPKGRRAGVQFHPEKAGRVLAIQYYQGSKTFRRQGGHPVVLQGSRAEQGEVRRVQDRRLADNPPQGPGRAQGGRQVRRVLPCPQGGLPRHGERPFEGSSPERVRPSDRSRRLLLRQARSLPHAHVARVQLPRRHRLQRQRDPCAERDAEAHQRDADPERDDPEPDDAASEPDDAASECHPDADHQPTAPPTSTPRPPTPTATPSPTKPSTVGTVVLGRSFPNSATTGVPAERSSRPTQGRARSRPTTS